MAIKLSLEEKATKAALEQIYMTSKLGIGGLFFMLVMVTFLLLNKIPSYIISMGVLSHLLILASRSYLVINYMKRRDAITDADSVNRWLAYYKIGTFSTGLAWGILFFFLDDVSTEYHFLIYGIIIGLAASGLFSLGTVTSIYASFMMPMLGISALWMFLQENIVYTIAALITLVGIFYYFITARRFANNFKQAIMEKEKLKASEQINQQLKERMELALTGSNTSVLDWNMTNNDFYISPSWKAMVGFSDEELPNTVLTWRERVHPDDKRRVFSELKKHKNNKIEFFENNHRILHKDGHWIWILGRAQILYDHNGKAVRMVGTHTDITELKNIEDELHVQKSILHHQAHHDALTTLPNRLLFNDRMQQGIKKAKRKKTNLALLFIDLDRFKQINDSLGHKVGDSVLQMVTERLRSKVRKDDTLARLGGDEFTVIMEELTHVQDASILAQKILEILAQPIFIDGHTLYVSSSIGISLYPQDSVNAHDLLKYADTAMYKAKDEGRNNFQFYSAEMTELAFERVVMEASLRQALKNEELVVYYQPQIDATTEKITGMEALVRWQHPSRGLVPPVKFIPLAEETGMIVEIDRWMMKTAMVQLGRWHKERLMPGGLSLNLSMKQLEQADFIQHVQHEMETSGFNAAQLELEVTEGEVMKKPDEAISKLKKISDLGIQIAIDDFGTGYSSLSYLKRLPINKLKIDRSFVKDIPDDEEDVAIVKAIIALAQSLNLGMIAEGVETADQKAFLLANGCKNIQGYHYARPMPADEMTAYLQKV